MHAQHLREIAQIKEEQAFAYAAVLTETELDPQLNALIRAHSEFSDLTYEKHFSMRSGRHLQYGDTRIDIECKITSFTSEQITKYYTTTYQDPSALPLRYSMLTFGDQVLSKCPQSAGPYQWSKYKIYLYFDYPISHSDKYTSYKIWGNDGHKYQFDGSSRSVCLSIDNDTVYYTKFILPSQKKPSRPAASAKPSTTVPSHVSRTPGGIYYYGDFYDNAEDLYDDWYEDFDSYEDAEWFFDHGD